VVFLDEPTAGLDPRGRLALWEQIKAIRDDGAAVLLTTQYLEEADQLADSIVIIDKGRAVAGGTADELKAQLQRDVLEVTFADDDSRAAAEKVLDAETLTIIDESTLHLSVSTATDSMTALRRVQDGGIGIAGFELRRPTLDDVFIDLTGGPADRDVGSGADEGEEQTG
jgi:ABC-2 type transport system ATP-binding protein